MISVKISERFVAGLSAAAAITTAILLVSNAHRQNQAASQMQAAKTDSLTAEPGNLSDREDTTPSIDTNGPLFVYPARKKNASTDTQIGTDDSGQDADAHANFTVELKKNQDNASSSQQGQNFDAQQAAPSDVSGSIAQQNKTFHTVTESYFSDAVFIGDSRTVGLQQSGLLSDASYYAKIGIGINGILTERIVSESGVMLTVEEALGRHTFGKVYLMIGANDISRADPEWFKEKCEELLAILRRTQPNAIIYIQGNLPIGASAESGSTTNTNLRLINEASRALTDSETIFYLPVNESYMDENGRLAAYFTSDGLHIRSQYHTIWADYLKSHAIVR